MKTTLLSVITSLICGVVFSQTQAGNNQAQTPASTNQTQVVSEGLTPDQLKAMEKFIMATYSKTLPNQDSVKLVMELNKYKFYNDLYERELKKFDTIHLPAVNSSLITSLQDYKEKRDSSYYNGMAIKEGLILQGKSKSKLDGYFPDDIAKAYKKETKKTTNRFMYLNAIDFDFADSKAGYVGHLNFYSPCEDRWGFGWNAGILKINYSSKDSISETQQDNVLLSPLDNLTVGSSYAQQFNKYKHKTKNTGYSIYMQSLLKLTAKENKNMIFFHGHAELLISRLESTIEINAIAIDTVTIVTESDIPENYIEYLEKKQYASQSYLSGNFGVGLTFDLYFEDKASLFFQATAGYTTNYPHAASVNTRDIENIVNRVDNSFYLIRAYYRHEVTQGTEIILSTDIRGLFPQYDPYYSVYLGLNLSIEKIAGLLK